MKRYKDHWDVEEICKGCSQGNYFGERKNRGSEREWERGGGKGNAGERILIVRKNDQEKGVVQLNYLRSGHCDLFPTGCWCRDASYYRTLAPCYITSFDWRLNAGNSSTAVWQVYEIVFVISNVFSESSLHEVSETLCACEILRETIVQCSPPWAHYSSAMLLTHAYCNK